MVTDGNAVASTMEYSYDEQNRLTKVESKDADGDPLSKYEYGYDTGTNGKGWRTSQTRSLPGGSPVTVNYEYDNRYQLSEAGAWDGSTVVYSYDELGNITQVSAVDGGTTVKKETYIYYGEASPHAGMNRLAAIWFDMDADGNTAESGDYGALMGYDENGNMSSRDVVYNYGGGTSEYWDFTYDQDDRLTEVDKDAQPYAEYRYDAFGRRVIKTFGGNQDVWFYDREDVLAEKRGANITKRFVNGPGIDDYIGFIRPAGQSEAGAYYYHTDGLGSITDLHNQSDGSLKSRYGYEHFGQVSVISGSTLASLNPHQYTSRDLDPESGLMFYRSRYYSPEQRRFVSEDRFIGITILPESYINRYFYSINNPIYFCDSNGEWIIIPIAIAIMMVGVLLGGIGGDNPEVHASQADPNYEYINALGTGMIFAPPIAVGATYFLEPIICAGSALAPEAQDPRLQNIFNNLFRGGNVGNGTTMDAIRLESGTWNQTHIQKGLESAQAIENWLINNPNASQSDISNAQNVLRDLMNALGPGLEKIK